VNATNDESLSLHLLIILYDGECCYCRCCI